MYDIILYIVIVGRNGKVKKFVFLVVLILLFTGCSNNKIIGKWQREYNIEVFGTIVETFEFKKNNECIRTISYGNVMTFDFKYEIENNKIKIVCEEKLDKDFQNFELIDNNHIEINGYGYERID